MSINGFPSRTNLGGTYAIPVRVLGTGAAVVTKVFGQGVTITRDSAGLHTYTFSDPPGNFVGFTAGFQATTPVNMLNHELVLEPFVAHTASADAYIKGTVYDGSAIDDLEALEWMNVTFFFRRESF